MSDFPCCGEPLNRGRTYTIETAPESTVDYKIGYHHGATGQHALRGMTDNYRDGFAAGFIVRREGKGA